jgi:hypothetical protein
MLKNKNQSKDKLQIRNHSNRNGINQKKNIFQLIEPVPKSIPIISKYIRHKFDFAQNLIAFLNIEHSETLLKLSFDIEKHDIDYLISELSKAIIELDYVIVFDSEAGNKELKIIYSVSDKEWMWYAIEYSIIDKIESEELKIGFSYLAQYISKHCYLNSLKYDYFQPDDNVFENEFDMMSDEANYTDEEGEFDEGMIQECNEEIAKELIRLRNWKDKFLKYIIMPYSSFLDYKPKNKNEKAFKEFIIKGLTLNFEINNKFIPYHNVYDDGGLSFEASMLMFFEMDQGVEESFFNSLEENAYNENSGPAGWYSVNNSIVTEMTTQKDIEDLHENFQYICDLYNNHLNTIHLWNI